MRLQRLAGVAVLATILGIGAACGGPRHTAADSATSTFNDQGNRALTCMAHQRHSPVAIDTPGNHEDVESVLDFLHYYTVNGNKRYCDGKPATSIDRSWLALYVAGGSAKSLVKRALS